MTSRFAFHIFLPLATQKQEYTTATIAHGKKKSISTHTIMVLDL
jgi:hypothetical protein